MSPRGKKILDPHVRANTLPISKIFKSARDEALCHPEFNPYEPIRKILSELPSNSDVSIGRLVSVYAVNSVRDGKPRDRIEDGIKRISFAYGLVQREFEALGKRDSDKRFRKDGETPLVLHSLRVAMIGAYLGAGSHQMAALLLHDCPEDCGVSIYEIKSRFGKRVPIFVALLTKPKLHIETRSGGIEDRHWVFLINDLAAHAKTWERMVDCTRPEHYEERLRVHMAEILNTPVKLATPEIKLKAHLYKLVADGGDNLVSDIHLDQIKARIRCSALVPEMRHLEITAPFIRRFFIELLRERGFDITDTRSPRFVPTAEVIECPPIDKRMTVAVLDSLPAPNGYIVIYVDDAMKQLLAGGRSQGRIRVELPHSAPLGIQDILQHHLQEYDLFVKCEPNESLLPWASETAGRHVLVHGINSLQKYQALFDALREFHNRHFKH